MTRLLHARLHRRRLRDMVTAQLAREERLPRPMLVVCPTCGEVFFADPGPVGSPRERELEEWEALARLDGECPDHPHRFIVGPFGRRR